MEIYRLTIVYFENNHEQVLRNMFVASGSGCENVSSYQRIQFLCQIRNRRSIQSIDLLFCFFYALKGLIPYVFSNADNSFRHADGLQILS